MADKESKFGGNQPKSKYGGTYVERQPLLEDTRIQRVIEEDPVDASGVGTAILSGLTNSETNKVFWLASKRFPEIYEQGGDPSVYYAFNPEDGDLYYRDPYSGDYKKEFADGPFGYDIDYLDYAIGPSGQFLAEVIPGSIGIGAGYLSGGYPGAMVGGAKGTAIGGSIAYATRAALSAVLGGPPLDAEKAAKDLAFSSVLGAVPFGVPTKEAPAAMKVLMEKFPGSDGRTILADIVQNGGKTVDEKLAYMQNKYPDIPISRAEASGLVGNKGYKAEVWMAKNARTEELVEHFESRNQRVAYHAELFFDHLLSGKYVKGDAKNKLTGKPALDAEFDVARAAEDYIALEKEKLAKTVAPIYKEAYDMDVVIDVSDILKKIDDVIANPNTSAKKLSTYKEMRQGLIDARFEGDVARSSTELLHEGLKDNFNRVISALTKDADTTLKREASIIRDQISQRLKSANPTYAKATRIYDDAIGTAQILDRSIVGQFAGVVEKGGEAAGRLTKKLFSGNINPKEITELKTILQTTEDGAQAWQNLKGTWLRTQWDDVVASQTNPLSEPSAYLKSIGVKQPTKSFPKTPMRFDPMGLPMPQSADELARLADEMAEYKAKGTKAKMWQAILEPDELSEFIDLTSMMQMVSRIQTQAGSDTFGNFSLSAVFGNEAKQIMGSTQKGRQAARKAGGILSALFGFTSRLTARGFDDMLTGSTNAQKEAYRDLLISHIVDPRKRADLSVALDATKPLAYLVGQTFTRSGIEGVTELFNTIEDRNQALREASEERKQDAAESEVAPVLMPRPDSMVEPQADPNLGARIESARPATLNLPMFEGETEGPALGLDFDPSMSPTILPRDDDRELAMRLRARRSGIGGLV
jgi:hypothetical protein